MPGLDAMVRYAELRAEHGLGPHDNSDPLDLERLDFFLSGVVSGTNNALLSVKEARGKGPAAGGR